MASDKNQPATKGDLIELEQRLERKFNRRIDVATEDLASQISDLATIVGEGFKNVYSRLDALELGHARIERIVRSNVDRLDRHDIEIKQLKAKLE